MRISDWSSDVCSSDLHVERRHLVGRDRRQQQLRFDRQHQLVFVEQQFFVEFLLVELGRQHQQLVGRSDRSEEHTSELQSLMRISYAVFCLKKKKTTQTTTKSAQNKSHK